LRVMKAALRRKKKQEWDTHVKRKRPLASHHLKPENGHWDGHRHRDGVPALGRGTGTGKQVPALETG